MSLHVHRSSTSVTSTDTGAWGVHTHLTAWGPSGPPLITGLTHYHLTGGAPTPPALNMSYGDILRQHLPQGPAWAALDGGELKNFLDGLGETFEQAKLRFLDLLEEFDPRTTTDLLPDWERVYGLPGDNPSPPTTLADRRAALWAKMLGYSDPTPAYFISLAAALGYTATITQRVYPVCVCNSPGTLTNSPASGCTSLLYDDPWAFVWTINATSQPTVDATLEWLVRSIAPDHTLVTFNLT
jgi:uncharacterized protein YmfQ (DUF2313 family)